MLLRDDMPARLVGNVALGDVAAGDHRAIIGAIDLGTVQNFKFRIIPKCEIQTSSIVRA